MVFDESKVINVLHPEKAEVGKKYWFADHLLDLKWAVEKNDKDFKELAEVEKTEDDCIFSCIRGDSWLFLYPYEEPPKQRMTNRQLAEWLAKCNGQWKRCMASTGCYTSYSYTEDNGDNGYIDECIVIRTWDSEEWVEPTVDIYERDCKGE